MEGISVINRLGKQLAAYIVLVLTAAALICMCPQVSRAELGFTYSIVKDFPLAATAIEESLCSFAFNDLGQVAYTTIAQDAGSSVALYFWDGATSQLIYRSKNVVASGDLPYIFCGSVRGGVGINAGGLISAYATGTDPRTSGIGEGFAYFRVGQGLVSMQFPGPTGAIYESRGILNSAGQIAWRDGSGGGGSAGGVVGLTGNVADGFTNTFTRSASVSFGGPIVNDKGGVVQFAEEPLASGDTSLLLLDLDLSITKLTAANAINTTSVWAPPSWSTPGFNSLGFTSLTTQGPSSAFPNRQFRVVLINPDQTTFSTLADETNTTLHPSGLPGSSLNSRNQVLFAVRDASTDSLWVTTSANSPPLLVWSNANPLTTGPTTITNASIGNDAAGPAFWINSSSTIAFALRSDRNSLIIAHPDPGVSPGNPILPIGSPLPGGGFQFNVNCDQSIAIRIPFYCGGGAVTGGGHAPGTGGQTSGVYRVFFIDPPLATGYQYTADAGSPNFIAVLIPAPLPGGQSQFIVKYNGISATLTAGSLFSFTDQFPAGVASFTVSGIGLKEQLDPADPQAFVTGVSVLPTNNSMVSFTMTPVVDGAAPSITPNVGGTVGANGWYTSDVTVGFTIADPSSRVNSQSGCTTSIINTDTAGTALTCTANGIGGPWSSTVTIKRDTARPAAAIVTPTSGQSFTVGSVANANYSCQDSLSGIGSCIGSTANGAALDTSSVGSKTFTVIATDNGGNVLQVNNSYSVVGSASDTTPPTIAAIVIGTVGDNGWYRSNVSLNWNVLDNQSAVTATHGCGAASVTRDTNGAAFTCSATSAGGTTSQSINIKRDDDAPFSVILWPLDGQTFRQNEKVPAVYVCADLRSGIAQCAGTVASGSRVDTATAGTKAFVLSAKDRAGNTRTSTIHYNVR
jgi:hypothetical protein